MRVEERSNILFVENYSRIAGLGEAKLAEIKAAVHELMLELERTGLTLKAPSDSIHTEQQQAYSQLLGLRVSVIRELARRSLLLN